ncbi:MAG: GIY-YIG nuclease family protein [Candidatus Omnitrophica bacterium]|nr:GIY-YIG nuclease family protein [Candidatus Omnitrophota bacterium]
MWYVYILQTKDNRLYTGATKSIENRVAAHIQGRGGRFTRTFGVEKLLYSEGHQTKSKALKREAQIKSWPRRKKIALIEDDKDLLETL